ncbi:type I polyketide synthase [Paenibacillus zanthoxyli]|uniref:type I polyketide synthase n=1 Tax=Paenibacillus zanthoxyli TaxID=369399 RepID=UPI00046F6E58|nr:type I polyketide synthase [Paenibacillus zanthoxyli]
MNNEVGSNHETGLEIAVIGMSGRFPGADNLEQYWELLMNGASAVSYFREEELISEGLSEHIVRHPNYVRAKPYIKNVYDFDASLFGYAPWEAQSMDPQTRIFHECVYHALENSGYHPEHYDGKIGLYAGAPLDIEWTGKHLSRGGIDQEILETGIVSSKDFLSQLISYKLNLSGPSYTLYTACSTSLAAIHLACQGLLLGDCNLAIAGGVTLEQPSVTGYLYEEGKIHSQSGVCRPFDSRADGTIFGEGAGAVVLKRLSDAVQDGDYIYAMIKGSSTNNDGRRKVGFAAPSLEGQKEVIRSAWEFADIDPSTIGYIEAHGTGTRVGDPIEFEALRQVMDQREDRLPIGSVKGNIGHLHAAAGIAGFIKAVLALDREVIPPTAGFEEPNPLLEMEESPFYVNKEPMLWKRNAGPRRAAISSFGVGGTNVHLILEEAPLRGASSPEDALVIMPFSAKSPTSLQNALHEMAVYLEQQDKVNLADAAYTLQVGRGQFNFRAVCIAERKEEAAQSLKRLAKAAAHAKSRESLGASQVVFMFTGQGSQYPGMGAELYRNNAVFRRELDHLAEKLAPMLRSDIRIYLCHSDEGAGQAGVDLSELNQTWLAQPALFALEYALAQVWISLGIKPVLMAGHSIGEYVAAALADVFSLDDALEIVVARGRLMQSTSGGSMVAAAVPASDAALYTSEAVSLAAVNSPELCVFSGEEAELSVRMAEWSRQGVFHRRLNTSHAFHSSKMDDILKPFTEVLRKKKLSPPRISFYSCLTGELIREDMAVNPEYWADQLRGTVHFSTIAANCLADEHNMLLEVGPGKTLCGLVEAQASASRTVLSSFGSRSERELQSFLESLACLWSQGIPVTWEALSSGGRRQRIPLPLYVFDRQTYILPSRPKELQMLQKRETVRPLLYQPVWKPQPLPLVKPREQGTWLILQDKGNLQPLTNYLLSIGHRCITVQPGKEYARDEEMTYTVNPCAPKPFHMLLEDLGLAGVRIDHILHGWCLEAATHENATLDPPYSVLERGYKTLIHLLAALSDQVLGEEPQLIVAATGIVDIYGSAAAEPVRRALMGPLLTVPHEYAQLQIKLVDCQGDSGNRLKDILVQETASPGEQAVVAYRGMNRLVQYFEPIPHEEVPKEEWEAQAQVKQVILYLSASGDFSIELFLETRTDTVILRSRGDSLQEIEQVVAEAARITGRIDGIIYEPISSSMEIRTLEELSRIEEPVNWNMTAFKHLNTALSASGATLGFGWILSSLASVTGGHGLCELAACASMYDAAADSQLNLPVCWTSVSRDFIRTGAYPVTGVTQEEALSVYKQLWRLRGSLSRAVISAIPIQDRMKEAKPSATREDMNQPNSSTIPAGLRERPYQLGAYAEPGTEAEKVLCELASEQLGVHPVGVEDHFYDLGAHSLLLTRLLSRIKDVFRIDLPLRTLLETPTVRGVIHGLEKEWGSRGVLEEIAASYREYQKLVCEEMTSQYSGG